MIHWLSNYFKKKEQQEWHAGYATTSAALLSQESTVKEIEDRLVEEFTGSFEHTTFGRGVLSALSDWQDLMEERNPS